MKKEIKERLIATARLYDDYKLFEDETGWEDWMNEFTDADDGEPMTESECGAINKILKECYNEAHKEAKR